MCPVGMDTAWLLLDSLRSVVFTDHCDFEHPRNALHISTELCLHCTGRVYSLYNFNALHGFLLIKVLVLI